jgi:multidrug efflux pump subunit AcrB
MENLKSAFRATWSTGLARYELPVSEGINEIFHTLLEAVALAIIVASSFSQNWRAR